MRASPTSRGRTMTEKNPSSRIAMPAPSAAPRLRFGTGKLTTILIAGSMLSACAKHTNEIPAQYTSPMQYQSYSCRQIEQEMQTVSRHMSEVGGQVDKTASNDSAQMGIGLVLFWPALFFLDGDTPEAQEYARLKGEFDALEKAGNQKDCHIRVKRPRPSPAQKPKQPSNKPRKDNDWQEEDINDRYEDSRHDRNMNDSSRDDDYKYAYPSSGHSRR